MAELAAGRVYELVKLEQKPAARAEQTRGPAPAGAAGAGGAGKESALRQPEPPPADGQGSTLATDRWRVAQKPVRSLGGRDWAALAAHGASSAARRRLQDANQEWRQQWTGMMKWKIGTVVQQADRAVDPRGQP